MQTKVTLISHTQDPLETLYQIWMENRDPNLHMSIDEIKATVDPKEVQRIFSVLMRSDISVIQNIHFTFKLENISIALREQLVRHRIGVNHDGRVGVDYVPNLTDDGIWIQSMRVLDMGQFYNNDAYEMPKEIAKDETATSIYKYCIATCQNTYRMLCERGIPRETARMVVPLAAQHDMFWTVNLGTICHILRKRGCWIPQVGVWMPIIVGIVDELATKIHPAFRELTCPPCVNNGKFTGCHFPEDTARRLDHSDPLPPCPLAVKTAADIANWASNVGTVKTVTQDDKDTYNSMLADFKKLWGFSSINLDTKEVVK